MSKKILISILSLHFLINYSFSQDDFTDEPSEDDQQLLTISGAVIDASTGRAVAGANVVVNDTDLGAAADEDGKFSIEGVQSGSGVTASAIGYEDLMLYADQAELNFSLTKKVLEFGALDVIAPKAKFRETPVAFSDVTKEELELRLGSRDLSMIFNEVPGA